MLRKSLSDNMQALAGQARQMSQGTKFFEASVELERGLREIYEGMKL